MVRIVDSSVARYPNLALFVTDILSAVLRSNSTTFDCFCRIAKLPPAIARDALSARTVSPILKVKRLIGNTPINGQFDPAFPDDIYLDEEIARRCADLRGDPDYQKLVEATILHETVHWAEHHFHGGLDNDVEWGWKFEECAYRNPIDRPWTAGASPAACGMTRACYELHDAGRLPIARPPRSVKGVPMADPGGAAWPVITTDPNARRISYVDVSNDQVGDADRSFAARKKPMPGDSISSDMHNPGVDLYAGVGDPVVATEDGAIVAILPFAEQTMAMMVRSDRGFVFAYGGLIRGSWLALKVADRVRAGGPLGKVGATSRGTMLHFGAYSRDATQRRPWIWGGSRPSELLNPTKYLLAL